MNYVVVLCCNACASARPVSEVPAAYRISPVQEFVPEPAIETFVVILLSEAPRLDERRFHPQSLHPSPDSQGRELRSAVRANMFWRTMLQKQLCQDLQDRLMIQPPFCTARQTLKAVLFNDRQHP